MKRHRIKYYSNNSNNQAKEERNKTWRKKIVFKIQVIIIWACDESTIRNELREK